jgi:hypothetical protein
MLLQDRYSSDCSDEDDGYFINEEEEAELENLKAILGDKYVSQRCAATIVDGPCIKHG